MKKLNRKGFTLVELLAVIVILAIVVGITLVTVLPTLKQSRQEAFELTAQTAADYFEKQYQLYIVGQVKESDLGFTFPIGASNKSTTVPYSKAGLKPNNYSAGEWYIESATGRACVKLTANTDGEYYDATGTAQSTGCTAS